MPSQQVSRRAVLSLLVAGSLLVGACTSGGSEQRGESAPTTSGGNKGIVVASIGDATSFHPYKTSDAASTQYQGLHYASGLIDRDPEDTEKFVPEMAESWTISDDKTTYTFKLRPNLVWSDGQPLTAFDFKWTYEQALKPENAYPYVTNLEPIESFEAPDARTLVIKLDEPMAIGLEQATALNTPLPRHIWEKYDWNLPERNPEIGKPTVGSGPFLLQEWVRDDHATFVANPNYFKGRPKLDSYTIRIAGNQQIGFQWLRSGEVDEFQFPPENFEEAKRLSNITVPEWWPASGNWTYIGYNFRSPALQDVKVRQALAYAINKNAIIERVMQNLARPIDSAYTPSCWCYDPNITKRDYNPERTRQMLDEAGWRVGADGIRTKDGQRLQLRLLYGPNSNRPRTLISQIAQDAFKQVGVGVEITSLEWTAYLQQVRDPNAWDITVGGWNSTIEPHWMFQIWSEETIPDLNMGSYRSPAVENLFKKGAREFNEAARKQDYFDIQRILAEDQPYIFLYQPKAYAGVNNRIGGIKPTTLGIEYNLHEWYVK